MGTHSEKCDVRRFCRHANVTECTHTNLDNTVKVQFSRYRPGVAHRVGRVIVLLFDDCGTRRGEWSAARPGRTLPLGKDPVPILQEAGWGPGQVWRRGKPRPHKNLIPDCPSCSQSPYQLSYPAHR